MDELKTAEEAAADALLLEIERGWARLDLARLLRRTRRARLARRP